MYYYKYYFKIHNINLKYLRNDVIKIPKMMIYNDIIWFKGEIRAHLFRSVLSYVSACPALFRQQGSIKVWSCLWKWIMAQTKEISLRTSEKELLLLIRLAKVTKLFLKSLDSTNPQSDRLCTKGGNSRPLLPSPGVVNQQRSLQKQNMRWSKRLQRTPFQSTNQNWGIYFQEISVLGL